MARSEGKGHSNGNGNGGLSTADRLTRIENLLERIDSKIETKSAQLDQKIETKTERIEQKLETKAERLSLESLATRMHAFELTGSKNAQEAIVGVHEIEKRVGVLEGSMASKDAVEGYRRWLWGLVAIGVLNMAWNLINLAGAVLRAKAGIP